MFTATPMEHLRVKMIISGLTTSGSLHGRRSTERDDVQSPIRVMGPSVPPRFAASLSTIPSPDSIHIEMAKKKLWIRRMGDAGRI